MDGILPPETGDSAPKTSEPEPEPEPAPVEEVKVILIMHSASWCAPCARWKNNEMPNVNCDVEVIEWDRQPGRPAWVTVYPTFELIHRTSEGDKQVQTWRGYTSARDINAAAQTARAGIEADGENTTVGNK